MTESEKHMFVISFSYKNHDNNVGFILFAKIGSSQLAKIIITILFFIFLIQSHPIGDSSWSFISIFQQFSPFSGSVSEVSFTVPAKLRL